MGNSSGVLRNRNTDVADPFDPSTSTLITPSFREAATMFETSPHFRAIFVEYLQTGVWIDTFMRKNSNFSHLDNNVFAKLLFLEENIAEDADNHERPVSVVEILECPERLQAIIVAAALPVFLESPEFQAMFAAKESGLLSSLLLVKHVPAYRFRGKSSDESHAVEEKDTCDQAKDSDTDTVLSAENSVRISNFSDSERSCTLQTSYVSPEDKRQISIMYTQKEESRSRFRLLMMRSLAVMDSLELDRMLAKASTAWLSELLVFVETLPIAVTVASFNQQQHTRVFYCNRKYESATGYSRQEMADQPCTYGMRLLAGSQSTAEVNQILRNTLPSVPSTTYTESTSAATTSAAVSPPSFIALPFASSHGDIMNKHVGSTCDVIVQHSHNSDCAFSSCSRIKPISSRPFRLRKGDSKASAESAQYVLTVHDDIARLKQLLSTTKRPKQTLTEELYAINHVLNLLPAVFCSS